MHRHDTHPARSPALVAFTPVLSNYSPVAAPFVSQVWEDSSPEEKEKLI